MRIDTYGQPILNETDLCNLFLQDPTRIVKHAFVEEDIKLDSTLVNTGNLQHLEKYMDIGISVSEFDKINQSNWHMPESYKTFDIAKYVLDKCTTEEELQRTGDELLKFQERGMFVLLQYLKYLVDTMRENKVVWGVGRGSSVASYVLYLIGVHRINSLYYQLSIDEFLK
jgi:DNA polymerase III alpha subunit